MSAVEFWPFFKMKGLENRQSYWIDFVSSMSSNQDKSNYNASICTDYVGDLSMNYGEMKKKKKKHPWANLPWNGRVYVYHEFW